MSYLKAKHLSELLISRGLTISVAESCTGGSLSSSLTSISGASSYFNCGYITYSNQSKIDCVSVMKSTINKYGAVSQQTANEMALGGIHNSQGNICLSITGIAGPSGGTKLKPVGTIFFAIAKKQDVIFEHHAFFDGNREDIREKALLFALNQLLALTL